MALYSEVNLKSYCTHVLYCPVQLSWLDFTALYRPLRCVTLSLLSCYEPKWRDGSPKNIILICFISVLNSRKTKTWYSESVKVCFQVLLIKLRQKDELMNCTKMQNRALFPKWHGFLVFVKNERPPTDLILETNK